MRNIFLDKLRQIAIDLRDTLKYLGQNKIPKEYIYQIKHGIGIEIGGPSWLWKTYLPFYRIAKKIDNALISKKTSWQDLTHDVKYKYYLFKKGDIYLTDEIYSFLQEPLYDFLISRNVIEHSTNPLKLLKQWRNLIKPNGLLCITIPNKIFTFDYARPYTDFKHLIYDYINDTPENDDYHFQEISDLSHDHKLPSYTSRDEFKRILRYNYITREAHHHVFSVEVICRLVSEAGFKVEHYYENIAQDIVVFAIKYDDKNLDHKPKIKDILKYET